MSYVTGFVNCKAYNTVKVGQPFEAFLVVQGKVASLGSSKNHRTGKILGRRRRRFKRKMRFAGLHRFPPAHRRAWNVPELAGPEGHKSIKELQKRLKDFASNATTPWILGHGWDQELFSEKDGQPRTTWTQ